MSSAPFHSHPLAAVMKLEFEDVPSLVPESGPFSPLPVVSHNTIFPQQPIQTPMTPTTQFLIPKQEFDAPPGFSTGYVAGDPSGVSQLERSFSSATQFYQNPWFSFPAPSYGGGDSRFSLVNLANIRTQKCSAEEKKVKIERYRAKRALRNFNKTTRYGCRKTLADGRRRVRGRFASEDEVQGMH